MRYNKTKNNLNSNINGIFIGSIILLFMYATVFHNPLSGYSERDKFENEDLEVILYEEILDNGDYKLEITFKTENIEKIEMNKKFHKTFFYSDEIQIEKFERDSESNMIIICDIYYHSGIVERFDLSER